MWAILIVCGAILLLTFYQIHTQGFFSTVIMAGDSMLAAFVALNYYEVIAGLLANVGMSEYGLGCICLLGLFSVTLLVLRIITDRLISGNINFPTLVDRIGATFFGLISSMIVVGMVLIGFQHLAIPAEFLKYNRYPNLEKLEEERSLFPGPDRFVLSLMSHASTFSFSGQNSFSQDHPDLLQELYLNRIVPKEHEGSRNEAHLDALKIIEARLINHSVNDLHSGQAVDIPAGETLLAIRLEIQSGSGKDRPGASDVDGKIRFALGDFRMVGHDQELSRSAGYSRYPIGLLKPYGMLVETVKLDTGKILTTPLKQVDLLFSWPDNLKKIPPLYVDFKRTARAELPSFEATLSKEKLYDASNIDNRAKLVSVEKSNNSFHLQELVVVFSSSQPLVDMGVPINSVVTRAEKIGHVDIEDGYYHLQTNPTNISRNEDEGPRLPLFVPDGFCLVYLKIGGNSSRKRSSYVSPVLVDVLGRKHHSIGVSLIGVKGKDWFSEFAYTSYDQQKRAIDLGGRPSKRFPKEIKLIKQADSIRTITHYYLLKQKDYPVGLLGVRVKKGRSDEGAFWIPSGDLDVVLVPAQ
jgi:uncharacterized membrane protein required for colicin V production